LIKRANRTSEQDLHEERKEIEVRLGRREAERIDVKVARFEADRKIRPAEKAGKAFKASAEIEDEGVGVILLEIRDQKIQKEGLPAASAARIIECAVSR